MSAKPCPVCSHRERRFIDALLKQGDIGPRSMTRRIGSVTRKNLTRHRDVCLNNERKETSK